MVDVLIAGAGPAGCVAAIALSRAGARVLLLDRATFPRDKLCGDTLNPGALRVLGRLGVRAAVEQASIPLDGMLVTGERGAAVCGAFGPGLAGRALPRRRLDAILLRAAIAAGAQFQDGVRVDAPIVDEAAGVLRVRGAQVRTADGRRLRLPAAVTIAADGRRSALALALGLSRQPARPRRWAVGAYYEQVAGLGAVGEMHIRAGHYIGVAPIGGGLANLCLVTSARDGFDQPSALLARRVGADPQLADRVRNARRVSRVSVLGPLAMDARTAGVPGLLLAGDAAGFVDPMTGDGLRLAMRGAELAADVALACLTDPRTDGPGVLARRRGRAFDTKMRINRAVRRVVSSPIAVRAASAASRLTPDILRALIRFEADTREDAEEGGAPARAGTVAPGAVPARSVPCSR